MRYSHVHLYAKDYHSMTQYSTIQQMTQYSKAIVQSVPQTPS